MKISWHVAGYGSLVLLLAGAVFAYERTKQDLVRSESVQQAQNALQKQLSDQISGLEKQMADRQAAYGQQIKSLERRIQAAQSPAQIAALVAQVMGLKQPIQITTPAPTATNPTPQPVAQVSLSDAPQVKAYVNECETCKLLVPKVQADLADREKQMALAQKEIDSLKVQRDAAVKATKGGSWMRRLVHDWRVAAAGAGIGAVAVCSTGHCK